MRFEELLIMHASPTLANLKPASLIFMRDLEHEKECMKKSVWKILKSVD